MSEKTPPTMNSRMVSAGVATHRNSEMLEFDRLKYETRRGDDGLE